MSTSTMRVLACLMSIGLPVGTAGAVQLDLVTVGNPGNAGEWAGESYGGYGPNRICGAVAYTYRIGKFEVTTGQYTAFLNAVAATDSYGLYSANMWSAADGCKIERMGTSGSYSYRVAADWANRSVNYVSWGDAVRFCNWLTNGQPTGMQNSSTTEDGSYVLNGATGTAALMAVTRKADARFVLPTEDEWFKAAYHKNDGVTGNYWDYPTGTNAPNEPGNNLLSPDPGNSANFRIGTSDDSIGAPYWRTEVGEFENSASAYGTYDQSGNVWEFNETAMDATTRVMRGGAYNNFVNHLAATNRNKLNPATEYYPYGFRIAEVPEPASVTLLVTGLGLLGRKFRRSVRECDCRGVR